MTNDRFKTALLTQLEGRSGLQAAQHFGISRQYWSNLVRGQRPRENGPLPWFIVAKAIQTWPTLADDLIADLLAYDAAESDRAA